MPPRVLFRYNDAPSRRRNPARKPSQTDTTTSSAAFRRWFGASKVVNAKGQPLVVYHGTDAEFDVFSPSFVPTKGRKGAVLGEGFYFTSDPKQAASYGKRVIAAYLRIEHPRTQKNGVLMDKSPDQDGTIATGTPGTRLGEYVYVVKSPTQIKSATANVGTFDPADPSILRNPRRRPAARQNPAPLPKAWHGSARAIKSFKAPAFFADDQRAARWFAVERAGAEPGVLMEAELDIRNPATSADLVRAAKAAGVEVVESPYFEAPEVSNYAPYDGSNPLDLVYIPKVRAELLKRGFDGVRAWDLLEADEIEVWITLKNGQAKVLATHRMNPRARRRR